MVTLPSRYRRPFDGLDPRHETTRPSRHGKAMDIVSPALHCLVALAMLNGTTPGFSATLSIPLTVAETAGVDRLDVPVRWGVPLPREAQLTETDGMALVDADTGEIIDADMVVTARWGGAPDDAGWPVRWILLAFRCSLEAGQERRLVLTDHRPLPPSKTITLTQGETLWRVDTGRAQFDVPTSGFNLFDRVVVDSVELISPETGGGPYMVDGADRWLAASAEGGSTLEVSRQGSRGQTLTLEIRSAHRTFGPGNPDDGADRDLEAVTWLTFTAGSASVAVHHTLQNNRPWAPLENNADIRRMQSARAVWFDEAGLAFRLDPGENAMWTVVPAPGTDSVSGTLGTSLTLYQDSSGTARWNQWRDRRDTGNSPVTDPDFGPSSYVSFRGWHLLEDTTPVAAGDHFGGAVALSGDRGGVAVAVRELWQNHPKAIRLAADGQVEIALFPTEYRARHGLRVGEQKSHEILLEFFTSDADAAISRASAVDHPLTPAAAPAWYAETTRSIATVSTTADSSLRFPTVPGRTELMIPDVTPTEWDVAMVRHLDGPGVPGYSFDGIEEAREASELFGWMDWGDLPVDFEGQWSAFPTTLGCGGRQRSTTGQYGFKYDGDFGLLAQYLRSGDRRFLVHGLAAVRHTADIDILHHGRQSGRGITDFRDGGMFGHSEHNDDGVLNPHRNGTDPNYELQLSSCDTGETWKGTPTADILFGAGGLTLGAWLTGDPSLAEALADLAEWALFFAENHGAGGNERAAGNLVECLAWAFEATGQGRYLDAAAALASDDPTLQRPMADGLFSGRLGSAVGHLVQVARQAGDVRFEALPTTVLAPAQSEQLSYALDICRADAHAWASLHGAGDPVINLDRARTAFASGALYPAWQDNLYGLSRVWQVKEWMPLLACGHVYQLAEAEAAGRPPVVPRQPPVTPQGGSAEQNHPPTATIDSSVPLQTTVGDMLHLSALASSDPDAGDALTWMWDFGDGTVATGAQVDHTWTRPGEYDVHLWVGDGEAFDHADAVVTVAFVNHPPTADAGPDRIAPVGAPVRFDGLGSADPDNQDLTFTWDFGDGASTTEAVAEHTWADPGLHTVTLTVSDGMTQAVDAATVAVVVPSGPVQTLHLDPAGDTYVWCCQGAQANYGGATALAVARQASPEANVLVRFDVAAVPPGSRIEQATLALHTVDVHLNGAAQAPIAVELVAGDWLEGDGDACVGCPGATWSTRDGVQPWLQGSGGDVAVGGPVATATLADDISAVQVDVTSLVQRWATGTPAHGLRVAGDPQQDFWWARFASAESTDPSHRPLLTVVYAPPSEMLVFADGFENGATDAWAVSR